MAKPLQHVGIRERFKVNRVLRPAREKYGDIKSSRTALEESVRLLETAVAANPGEWILWYTLGDLYPPLGEFAKSVRAAQRCYDLRPKDPRSTYALATNLRELTHAKYVGQARYIAQRRGLLERISHGTAVTPFDPDISQQALDELGMTVDHAAERSLTLFEQVLTLGVPEPDAIHVHDCLAAMYSEFPHLEQTVKSTGVAPKGILAEARGDPFNQAVEHYQKLRYLGSEPSRLQEELLEVIRLTQVALAKDRYNGDAMVLLAHALLLASFQALQFSEQGYAYFVTRAASVIEHWSSTPARTRNRENGKTVHWRIRAEIEQPKALTTAALLRHLTASRQILFDEALDPRCFPDIQRLIQGGKTI